MLTVGDMVLDTRARTVFRGTRELHLTKTEFDLLEMLMINVGIVLERDVLYDRIWGFNFGMGLALSEKASFSIGYDHSSVGKTEINGLTAPDAVRVQLGTLLLGYSYRLDAKRTINVSLGAGLTTDTPDVTLTFRMPFSL